MASKKKALKPRVWRDKESGDYVCADCGNDEPACGAVMPSGGHWICTRTAGHTGNHRACTNEKTDHPIAEWQPDGKVIKDWIRSLT